MPLHQPSPWKGFATSMCHTLPFVVGPLRQAPGMGLQPLGASRPQLHALCAARMCNGRLFSAQRRRISHACSRQGKASSQTSSHVPAWPPLECFQDHEKCFVAESVQYFCGSEMLIVSDARIGGLTFIACSSCSHVTACPDMQRDEAACALSLCILQCSRV